MSTTLLVGLCATGLGLAVALVAIEIDEAGRGDRRWLLLAVRLGVGLLLAGLVTVVSALA